MDHNNPDAIEALIRGDGFQSQTGIIEDTDSDIESGDGVDAEEIDVEGDRDGSPGRLKKQFSTTVPASGRNTGKQDEEYLTYSKDDNSNNEGKGDTKTSLSSGFPTDRISKAISKIDFKMGLENATADMIKEHMLENENRAEMRRIAKIMQNNDFFKVFVNQY